MNKTPYLNAARGTGREAGGYPQSCAYNHSGADRLQRTLVPRCRWQLTASVVLLWRRASTEENDLCTCL